MGAAAADETVFERAQAFVRAVRGEPWSEPVTKALWGSPGGSYYIAKRVVAAMPDHRVYVEPFAGGAQVFYAKRDASKVEVLADKNPEIAFAFRFVKHLTAKQLDALKRKSWVADPDRFLRLRDAKPDDPVERFYRFAYVTHFSFNKLGRGTLPTHWHGAETRFVDRLEKFAPRLRHVIVRCADYEDVVDEFDGKDTFFFLDPPFPGYDAALGHKEWDEERFRDVLEDVDGKFLVRYGTRSKVDALFKGFHVERWRHASGVGTRAGHGLHPGLIVIATNYRTAKAAPPASASVASAAPEDRQMLLPHVMLTVPGEDTTTPEPVEKIIWSSPAGKKRIAKRLVKLIPPHKTYVEPFAGSAAVFFEKEPAAREVISDADPEIAAAYKAVATLSKAELAALAKEDWVGKRTKFKSLLDAKPTSKVGKLYRFLYLSRFSYGNLRGTSFNPHAEGVGSRVMKRIEQDRPRLQNTIIRHAHYADIIKEFDSKDTFFFLDPPYVGHNAEVDEDKFDEAEFRKVLDGIKGKFLVTYGTRGELDTSGFTVKRFRTPRTIRTMRGVGGSKWLNQLLISNYKLTEKRLGPFELEDVEAALELPDDVAADLDYARALAADLGTTVSEPIVLALADELERIDSANDERSRVLARELLPLVEVIAPTLDRPLPDTAKALRAAVPALERLATPANTNVEKARLIPFQQWGGSAKYARQLAGRFPEHERYVEPFCGAAATFYAKDAADEEVLADADPEVVFAHKYIQKLDDKSFAALKKYPWRVSRAGFARAKAAKPTSDAERFWKHVYGRIASWGAKPDLSGYATIHDGSVYDLDDLWKFHKRLQGATIVRQDWLKTLKAYDGKDALFFIDPPYEDEWSVGDGISAAATADAVATLRGQYVIAYTDSPDARKALAKVGRSFTLHIPEGRHAGKWQKRSRLFVASSGIAKSLGDLKWLDAPTLAAAPLPPTVAAVLAKRIPVLKTADERYVLGIVLEPETVDAQNDIYSAAEVREAAHKFMAEYRNRWLMHQRIVNDKVDIVESYIAPVDFELGGQKVKKGTWLLAEHILDDELWQAVKSGALGGFSIGGSAARQLEREAA